jgi:hypothetical protein
MIYKTKPKANKLKKVFTSLLSLKETKTNKRGRIINILFTNPLNRTIKGSPEFILLSSGLRSV